MPIAIPTPNDLYSGLLTDLGYTITPSGDVMDGTTPVFIEHRHLVLPTNAKLKESNWGVNIPFHPLCENVYRGESTIIQFLRNAVVKRMTQVLGMYLFQLAEISRTKDQKMSQEVKKFLQILPEVDDKFVTIVTELIMEATKEGSSSPLIHIFLKRGGTVSGNKVSRAAIVTFPILDKLKAGDQIGNVKPRKKDIPMLLALFNYAIYGDAKDHYNNVTQVYNYGSTDLYAPYFDAIVGGYYKLAKAIKDSSYKFRIQIAKVSEEDLKLFQPDLSWVEYMKDISTLRALIPVLPDSEGAPVQGAEEQQPVVQGAAPVQPVVAPVTVVPPTVSPVKEVHSTVSGAPAEVSSEPLALAIHPNQLAKAKDNKLPVGAVNANALVEQAKEQELQYALAGGVGAPAYVTGGYAYGQSTVPLYLQQSNGVQPQAAPVAPYNPYQGYQQYPMTAQTPLYLAEQSGQQMPTQYHQQPVQNRGPGYGI